MTHKWSSSQGKEKQDVKHFLVYSSFLTVPPPTYGTIKGANKPPERRLVAREIKGNIPHCANGQDTATRGTHKQASKRRQTAERE